jgi:phosphoribosylglycinamide formyltransferase-1
MAKKLPIVILISGKGSNLQAIIDAINAQQLDAEIRAVISNRADAYGLERAKQANIPTQVLLNSVAISKQNYDHELQKIIDSYQPALIILAGFMRILTPEFVRHFSGKIINIHPSLLPNYPGLHTHQRVIQAGDKEHGVTVHWVTDDLDAGPIIAQVKIPVDPADTPETLKAKIHREEHKLYPQMIQWVADGKL